MVRLVESIIGLALSCTTVATPLQPHLHARQNSSSPCAQVGALAASQPSNVIPTVPAKLAYDCITSVPFNQSAALALVDGMVPYFRWQSTTAFLKDPPAEYAEKVQPAVDIWGELQDIRTKVVSGSYANEFEFGFELYTLLQSTHDGHFVYVPDVVGTVFNYARPVPLVSASSDGKELPKPYVYADILAESLSNSSFKASPVAKIDGQDAKTFLENWAQYGSLQDRDALYNNVFYELATVSLGPSGSGIGTFAGSGRGRWVYPGPTTTLQFENGTSRVYQNFARVLIPFTGITDGESLYKLWFTGTQPTSSTPSASASSTTPTPTATATTSATATSIPAPGYPPPVVREAHNLIGGYYLEGDYSDVAVLSVPSFVGIDAQFEFQQTATTFLTAAKAAGKKKLVVDVQANGGGTILLGYDLYKLLFPNTIGHAAADRFRAFESTDVIGTKFSDVAEQVPRLLVDENSTLYDIENDVVSSVFNYQTDEDVNEQPFSSWDAKFGPGLYQKGDNYTNLFRWNLSDVLTPINSGGIYVHGYGPLSNYTEQPFAAEDVVVVSDGYCASTCTIFSELMRQRAGVKYISLGGRAREGITQAVGGVKGTNNYPWTYIQALAQYTVAGLNSTIEESQELNKTELNQYWSDVVFERLAIGSSVNVNFRDGIRDGDSTNTPLQFVYEEADCRILYTKAMTYDVTNIWKAAADSKWYGKNHCVAGSLGNSISLRMKRSLSVEERSLNRRLAQWRTNLNMADYPLDLRTDLRQAHLQGDGIMYP